MRRQRWDRPRDKERQLRAGQTDAERLVWNLLRNRGLGGLKFRRQHRIGDYILDFYCPELHLGIELDGAAHFTETGKLADQIRSDDLAQQGIKIIRFENKDVIANPAIVSTAVLNYAANARL